MISTRRHILSYLLLALAAGPVPAAPIPYQPDPWTLHLWHLDEPGPPFADAVPDGLELRGLLNNAQAGQTALPGLGASVSFNHDAGGPRGTMKFHGAILLAAPALAAGPEDNAPESFRFAGETGAFTYEVLAKFDRLPAEAGLPSMALVTMDGEGSNRVFDFRIESSGLLAFIPFGQPEGGGALAAIPTTGEHALSTTDWFHVAVAYDGREGAPNNTKLYWTRLDAPRTAAHLIGSGTLLEDLTRKTADFALGNEGRDQSQTLPGNAEAEPFPGCLDEVRLSSIARDPTDFLFVEPAQRASAARATAEWLVERPPLLSLSALRVDGETWALPGGATPARLSPGPHRLDFDFGAVPQGGRGAVKLCYRLRGLDERWNECTSGMLLAVEALDARGQPVSTAEFPALGLSRGWQTSLEDSPLAQRVEPFRVPPEARTLRITLSSGADDTTGLMVIDNLEVIERGPDGRPLSLWSNSAFNNGDRAGKPEGTPTGWGRVGSSPMIARMTMASGGEALALVDGDQSASASWTGEQPLPPSGPDGQTLLLRWNEAYNVIGGTQHRATFLAVPRGSYVFEAVATTTGPTPLGSHFDLPFTILPPLTARPWFWIVVASLVVGSLAVGVLAYFRQRAFRRLDQLRLQNALAQDRARIARDLHDDLGTRITLLTMNATLAQGDLDTAPENARQHLARIAGSARDLVTAMDDLVWAVDPANDTLDQLADHLARLAEEMFHASPIRCRVQIPHTLPERTVTSDFRHHLSLAVKEALHNILRHAGPCEATLELAVEGDHLRIEVADTGCGYDSSLPSPGRGRGNLPHRMQALGGACVVESAPGRGTKVVLRCPLPPAFLESTSP